MKLLRFINAFYFIFFKFNVLSKICFTLSVTILQENSNYEAENCF